MTSQPYRGPEGSIIRFDPLYDTKRHEIQTSCGVGPLNLIGDGGHTWSGIHYVSGATQRRRFHSVSTDSSEMSISQVTGTVVLSRGWRGGGVTQAYLLSFLLRLCIQVLGYMAGVCFRSAASSVASRRRRSGSVIFSRDAVSGGEGLPG